MAGEAIFARGRYVLKDLVVIVNLLEKIFLRTGLFACLPAYSRPARNDVNDVLIDITLLSNGLSRPIEG